MQTNLFHGHGDFNPLAQRKTSSLPYLAARVLNVVLSSSLPDFTIDLIVSNLECWI